MVDLKVPMRAAKMAATTVAKRAASSVKRMAGKSEVVSVESKALYWDLTTVY